MNRSLAALCALGILFGTAQYPARTDARPMYGRPIVFNPNVNAVARSFTLKDGRRISVDQNGFATIYNGSTFIGSRSVPASLIPADKPGSLSYDAELSALQWAVEGINSATYAPNRLIVVFKNGVSIPQDRLTVSRVTLSAMATALTSNDRYAHSPQYTNDTSVNHALADAGVLSANRLFASQTRAALSSMRSQAQARLNKPLIDISNAFALTITRGSVEAEALALRRLSSVAYVSPDWAVSPMHTALRALPNDEQTALRNANVGEVRRAATLRSLTGTGVIGMGTSQQVPQNYGVVSNMQSLLDSSGIDDLSAYQEIVSKFHQLPGTGEIITNVSVGDTFAAEDSGQGQTCQYGLSLIGPLTQMIAGQRYLNWPGLPLIPAYAADSNGHTDPSYVSCGNGDLGEVGLDFTMMSPLPDNLQRPGEIATSAIGDVVGIAPGATYRLFVPATNTSQGGNFLSNIDGVFLAAAQMAPKTNVITASLGEGFDVNGFPGRFLEDDPLTQSVIATIVNGSNIVVCISANDGMRSYTPTAIGISGGSAPTNVVTDPTQTTNLNDLAYSTAPSQDIDSGAIDVGGTTLNDIYARPPNDTQNASFASILAYPETRYDGAQDLSSGYGSRVNISAPADNVVALNKIGMAFDAVGAFSTGGTSASAPEVAAVAAIAMQVANLTGHSFSSASAVRNFLEQTATPVTQPAMTDVPLNVGPQVNVRRVVEQLLANAGMPVTPGLSRIAVYQRRSLFPLSYFDAFFFTNTDLTNVNLAGHDYGDGRGPDGSGSTDYIDIAPDWRGIPPNAQYSLFIAGHPDRVLSTSPTARMLPSTILQAAGIPIPNASGGAVNLTYRATQSKHILAQGTVEVDFGPTNGTSVAAPAPLVPAVVSSGSFQVKYDLSKVRLMNNPQLVITEPGRFSAAPGFIIHFAYAVPLSQLTGTVTVPVSALQGAGIYGVGILGDDPTRLGDQHLSDLAIFRVQTANTGRPAAPLLASSSSAPLQYSHILEIPFGTSVSIKWDASAVPNASGASLEVSAPGPTRAGLFSTFNNPNGSERDNNGVDTGSVTLIPLPSISGTATFSSAQLGLNNTMFHTLRIIATSGGVGLGEGGDVSSITEDGQTNSIGGNIKNGIAINGDIRIGGFAINPNGSDGVILPWISEGAWFLTSVDRFDQTTHLATPVIPPSLRSGPLYISGGSMFAPDSVFYAQASSATPNLVNSTLYSTFASFGGTNPLPSFVTLPSPTDYIVEAAYAPSSSSTAVLYYDTTTPLGFGFGGGPKLKLASFNVASSLLGLPITTNLPQNYGFTPFSFGADMSLNEAIIVRSQFPGNALDLINLQTGATTTTPAIAQGAVGALAVDDVSHVAMSNSVSDHSLVLYNLQTGAQSKIPMPVSNSSPWYIAADTVNHLFLVYALLPPNGDYNATLPLYVLDESGNCLKTVTGWNGAPGPDGFENDNQYLQVNGHTRTAYLVMGTQLAIINY